MIRRLLNLVAILSVLCCVASAAAWSRSYRVADLVFWTAPDVAWSARVVSGRGGVGFVFDRNAARSETGIPGGHWVVTPAGGYARGGWQTRYGFAVFNEMGMRAVAVPYGFLCVLCLLPLAPCALA